MKKKGLFIGLTTLDFIYLTASPPLSNEKIVASDYAIAAGGPATNAAVTFSYLGYDATLIATVGLHPMTNLIRGDIGDYDVELMDLNPMAADPPPISSIMVTESTGTRAVVSINASKSQVNNFNLGNLADPVDLILIDGHQILVGHQVIKDIKANQSPLVVLDGGSWKKGLEQVLPLVDYAICSANFFPPSTFHVVDVIKYLQGMGIKYIAITQGEQPIYFVTPNDSGQINVPMIKAIDTLGAGDIFHGAFCYYILQESFTLALANAAKVAAYSCQFFGSREWMRHYLKMKALEYQINL